MFIIWGKKAVFRKLGYVAEYCPQCKDERVFTLQRVGIAGHVYYISSGEGELRGYQGICQTCANAYHAEPSHYLAISKKNLPLQALKQATSPHLDAVMHERMEFEKRVKNNPYSLSKQDRLQLIRNAFNLLSPKVDKHFSSTHIDIEIGLSIVGAIALLYAGPGLLRTVFPEHEGAVFIFFLVAGFLLIAWQVIAAGHRYMRRTILPLLAHQLAHVRPTADEIQATTSSLAQLRQKIGAKTKAHELMAAISTAREDV
jgi:hypothetical protein